jgi:hypothetical protein
MQQDNPSAARPFQVESSVLGSIRHFAINDINKQIENLVTKLQFEYYIYLDPGVGPSKASHTCVLCPVE